MSMTVPPAPLSPLSPFAILWNREDCARLEAAGILNYRYELVEGVINRMSSHLPYSLAVSRLTAWLYRVFTEEFVQSQSTIDVSPEDNPTNAPQPDAVVTNTSLLHLIQTGQMIPAASQINMAVEVSATTLQYDLTIKASLYARAGIPEYWVIDLTCRRLHIFRRPVAGIYRDTSEYSDTDTVTCASAPNHPVSVATLLT